MTDKPLDCVGNTGTVGKHDFKLHPLEDIRFDLQDTIDNSYDARAVRTAKHALNILTGFMGQTQFCQECRRLENELSCTPSEEEWENMVSANECLNAEIEDLNEEIVRINDERMALRGAAWLALEELSQWQGLDESDEGTKEAIRQLTEILGTDDK